MANVTRKTDTLDIDELPKRPSKKERAEARLEEEASEIRRRMVLHGELLQFVDDYAMAARRTKSPAHQAIAGMLELVRTVGENILLMHELRGIRVRVTPNKYGAEFSILLFGDQGEQKE